MKKLKIFLVCAAISALSIFCLTACFNRDRGDQNETGNETTTSSTNNGSGVNGSTNEDNHNGTNGTTNGDTNNGTNGATKEDNHNGTNGTTNGNNNNGMNGTNGYDNNEAGTDEDGNLIEGIGDMINDGLDEVETVIDDIDGNNTGNNSRMR